MDKYMWEMTVSQINLAKYDTTHIEYLSDKEIEKKKTKVINSAEDLINDLGFKIPI